MAWSLASGERYSGVGMVVDDEQLLVVAWGGQGSNGVVFYTALVLDFGEIEWVGWWCQPDGRMGTEDLGPPVGLDGAHSLLGGDSGTGTVTFTRVSNSKTNYTVRWETSQGTYAGFGTRIVSVAANVDVFGGFWGSSQGGVSLFGMNELDEGSMAGVWALVGETGQGGEILTRR